MTHDVENYDEIFSGTKEVAVNLQIDAKKLQPWIDANVPDAGQIEKIEQFKGGQSNPTYKIITKGKFSSPLANKYLNLNIVSYLTKHSEMFWSLQWILDVGMLFQPTDLFK